AARNSPRQRHANSSNGWSASPTNEPQVMRSHASDSHSPTAKNKRSPRARRPPSTPSSPPGSPKTLPKKRRPGPGSRNFNAPPPRSEQRAGCPLLEAPRVRERRILITDLELGALPARKRLFDATDHYDRADVVSRSTTAQSPHPRNQAPHPNTTSRGR